MDEKSQRSAPRFAASLPAQLHHGGVSHPCAAHDLSRKGTLLVGDLPALEDPTVDFTLTTAAGDVQLRLSGHVVHVQREGARVQRVGLEFRDLKAEERQTLEALLQRLLEGMAPAALNALAPGTPPHQVRECLDKIPLAHRIQLAARALPREREFLRQDSHPQVLEALARNPNLVLPEAQALAKVPHLLPTTIDSLATDPRWARDDELKVLIATHPRTTLGTADQLVAKMNEPLLQRVLQRPGLHPAVREKAMVRLAKKHRNA